MFRSLEVTTSLMRRIDTVVRAADTQECLGLLASPAGAGAVSGMVMLHARASLTSAEAAPLAVKRGADALRAHDLVPRGIWHSHGRMGVFHSGTDRDTIHRLLPAMASWNFERDSAAVKAPAVQGPETAVLPLRDGRFRVFTLVPAPLPGTDLFEPARWGRIDVEFGPVQEEPCAAFVGRHLHLASAGVTLRLEVPERASVETRVMDPARVRVACLYSLVVNTRGDRYAQCLVVLDAGGESITRLGECDVIELPGEDQADPGYEAGELPLAPASGWFM